MTSNHAPDLFSNLPGELATSFEGRGEVRGYKFKQLKASSFGYIYEVSASNGCVWYEVFKRKEDARFGKIAYPKSNSFGKSAWTVKGYQDALARFDDLKTRKELKHGH